MRKFLIADSLELFNSSKPFLTPTVKLTIFYFLIIYSRASLDLS